MSERRRVLTIMERVDLPSSYVSGFQFADVYARHGYQAEFLARRNPETLRRIERSTRLAHRLRMPRLAQPWERKIVDAADAEIVRRAAEADVVVAIKIISLPLIERIRALGKPRILMVFNDAFWLPFAREQGWEDLEKILAAVHGVICVNEFTAEFVRRHNPNVFVIPDSPQLEDFERRRASVQRTPGEVRIGWIGSPLTATSLFRIWEPLEELARLRDDWSLRVVGTGGTWLANLPRFERVRWSRVESYDQGTMIDEVLGMDIGLFPLFAGDDSRARGYMKAAIYMAGEVAVVAQNYGDNVELIDNGVNGLLAATDAEWLAALQRLLDRPDERRAIASRGLATVRQRLSREVIFEQFRGAIESV